MKIEITDGVLRVAVTPGDRLKVGRKTVVVHRDMTSERKLTPQDIEKIRKASVTLATELTPRDMEKVRKTLEVDDFVLIEMRKGDLVRLDKSLSGDDLD